MADLKTELNRKAEYYFDLASRYPRAGEMSTPTDVGVALLAVIVNGAKAEAFREAAGMADHEQKPRRR